MSEGLSQGSRAPEYLPALTGLRGLAAVWVLLFHLWPTLNGQLPELFGHGTPSWVAYGYLGVDVFFVLSGFIMAHVHAADFSGTWSMTKVWRFLGLRLARIFPLHLHWLLITAVVVLWLPGFARGYRADQFAWADFPYALLLMQNWVRHLPTMWNGPAWSLSAEWLAYLLFPLLMWAMHHSHRALLTAVAAACVALPQIAVSAVAIDVSEGVGWSGMMRMLSEFVLGMIIWRATRTEACSERTALLIAAAMAGVGVAVFAVFGSPTLLVCLLVAWLALRGAKVTPVFNSWLVQKLGQLSFSIYLSHWLLVQCMNWAGRSFAVDAWPLESRLLWIAAVLALLWLAAECSYRWVEVPGRLKLRAWLLPTISPRAAKLEKEPAR